jgi:hypothetical protein
MFLTSPLIEQALALKMPGSQGPMSASAMLRQQSKVESDVRPGKAVPSWIAVHDSTLNRECS